jgi:ketosteroid isomerase-like protein
MRHIMLVLMLSLFLPAMTQPQPAQQQVTIQFLQTFADAFNAHDLNAIMDHMTPDCVFEASAGTQVDGEKYVGQQEVRKAFEAVFATFHDAHWGNARHVISGDRGFSEWVFSGTTAEGKKVQVTGVDLFTFRDGKIAIKNSYRKNRTITL